MTEPNKLSPEEEAREWLEAKSEAKEWGFAHDVHYFKSQEGRFCSQCGEYMTDEIHLRGSESLAEARERRANAYASHVSAADKARIAELEEQQQQQRAEAAEARVKELEAENEKIKAEFIKSLIDRGAVDWERVRVRVAELQKREGKR